MADFGGLAGPEGPGDLLEGFWAPGASQTPKIGNPGSGDRFLLLLRFRPPKMARVVAASDVGIGGSKSHADQIGRGRGGLVLYVTQ